MKKRIFIMVAMLTVLLFGCKSGKHMEVYGAGYEETIYASDISQEDCCLCGNGNANIHTVCWGQNNIGIICLNTFEIIPLEINRYDTNGILIQEKTSRLTTHSFRNQTDKFFTYIMEEADRGYAHATISFYGDEVLDVEKAASFLCKECLNRVVSKIYEESFSIGVINFSTKEIRMFEKCISGFSCGDFYIYCDLKEMEEYRETKRIDFMAFYCPVRYEEESELDVLVQKGKNHLILQRVK